MKSRFALALSVALVFTLPFFVAACGSNGSTPTTPSPPAPVATTRIINVFGSMAFGAIDVGSSFSNNLAIQNQGNASLTITSVTLSSGITAVTTANWSGGTIAPGATQNVTVKFTPAATTSYTGTITVKGDQTSGTNAIAFSGSGAKPPTPPGGATSFGTGQFRVGTDITAGRFFSDPPANCYWERQSGFGGTLAEILANDFVSYNAGQIIVDIASSDKGFKSDACGTWFRDSPRRGFATNITPGMWLVGSQIAPGTYQIGGGAGCYWERLRGFSGNVSDIIANNFSSTATVQFVTISGGDVGFNSDGDCGTWAPSATLANEGQSVPTVPSREDIEQQRTLYRQKIGR
jgi:hypothetical protein